MFLKLIKTLYFHLTYKNTNQLTHKNPNHNQLPPSNPYQPGYVNFPYV